MHGVTCLRRCAALLSSLHHFRIELLGSTVYTERTRRYTMWKRLLQTRSHALQRVVTGSGSAAGGIRKKHQLKSYIEQYQRSLQSPQEFWGEAAEDIEWFKRCDKVLDT